MDEETRRIQPKASLDQTAPMRPITDTQPTIPLQPLVSISEAVERNSNPHWKLPVQDLDKLPDGPLKTVLTNPAFDPRAVVYIDEKGKPQRYIDRDDVKKDDKPEYVSGGTTLFIVHSTRHADSAIVIDAAPADDISLIMEAIFKAGDHDDLSANQIAAKISTALKSYKKYMHNRAQVYQLPDTDSVPQGEEWLK